MNAQVISLGDMDEQDEAYQSFIKDIGSDPVVNSIFWIEKADGTLRIGCNYDDRRDLVYALYKIQNLIHSILAHEGN